MVLAVSPVLAAPAADLELLMDVNGIFAPDAAVVYSGGALTYTIAVTNHGPDPAVAAIVTGDIVPWAATFNSADPSVGTYDDASSTWTMGTLAAGATETLLVHATAIEGPQTRVQNAANASSDTPDPNSPAAGKNAFFTILSGAAPEVDLDVGKFVDNATPREGDTIVYTVKVANIELEDSTSGPNDATNVKIRDNFPAQITYTSDNSGGAYDPATGIWDIGTLVGNEPGRSLEITGTVNAGTEGSTIKNVATVESVDQSDPNPDDNTYSAYVTIADPVNRPPSPVEPDGDGNLVPVGHVSETIAVGETPAPLAIVDPEGDAWTVRIQSGVLPAGLTMNDQGVFSGAATEAGTFDLTMETCDDRTPPACSTFTYHAHGG